MKSFLSIIIFSLFCISAFSQWSRTNGPEGISMSSLANFDGVLYAGTQTEGLYSSEDDGLSWFPLNNGIENIEVTAIDSLPGYLFAGTFGGGVFRSTDGGQTWLPSSNATDLAVTSLVIQDTVLFAGTISDGVQRSYDYGETWTEVFSGFIGIFAMGVNSEFVFASVSNYTFATEDYGNTWFDIEDLEGASVFSYYTKDSLVMIGARNSIYKSTDYGNNFTFISIPFPFSIVNINTITAIGADFYIGTSYDGVYKSTDDGFTWNASNQDMGPKDVRALTVSDASTLLAGSHYVGVYRSEDQGTNWMRSMTGFPAGSTISCMMQLDTFVFAGTRDGVYRTSDNGNTWLKMEGDNDTVNYSLVRGLCEKDGVIYAGMNLKFSGEIYKTTDFGATWVWSGSGLPPDLTFINGVVSLGGNLVAATSEGIFYSSDDGSTWQQSNIPSNNISAIAASENYAFAPVTGAGIYRSDDHGITWQISLVSPGVDFVEVAAKDNYAYAGSFFSGARYSSNNGNTWFASSGFPFETSVFALGPFGEEYVLAGTDLGPSWIWMSYNNGSSFQPFSEGLGQNAVADVFTINDTFMFAGATYNGVWKRLRPELVRIPGTREDLAASVNLQMVPNPFSGRTEIRFTLPADGRIIIDMFDISGRKVRNVFTGTKSSGQHRIEFHSANLLPGIYFCKLTAEGHSQVRKMVISK